MRSIKILFAIVVLISGGLMIFVLPSCEKIKDATRIKVKYDLPNQYFNVDSVSLFKTEKLLFAKSFNTNIDSIVDANKGSLGDVKFSQIKLSVDSPTWVTLSWLASVRATITPEGGSPIEVATSSSIDANARTIDIIVKNTNIASSVKGPFMLSIYGNLNGPVPAAVIRMLLQPELELSISPF